MGIVPSEDAYLYTSSDVLLSFFTVEDLLHARIWAHYLLGNHALMEAELCRVTSLCEKLDYPATLWEFMLQDSHRHSAWSAVADAVSLNAVTSGTLRILELMIHCGNAKLHVAVVGEVDVVV